MSLTLANSTLSAVPHASLKSLRASLVRDLGDGFAAVLQDAGYAGGETVFGAFREWCGRRGEVPEEMSYALFQQNAAQFFAEAGWGSVTMTPLGDVAVAIDSADWAEADPAAAMPYPACYYSAGMLADFFGRVADGALGCLEVECRTSGAARCRFVLGSPEVITHIYQRLTEGVEYEVAIKELA
ncbi:MAG: V4R domain-containing protein [Gemmatimonadaceae bacterium]